MTSVKQFGSESERETYPRRVLRDLLSAVGNHRSGSTPSGANQSALTQIGHVQTSLTSEISHEEPNSHGSNKHRPKRLFPTLRCHASSMVEEDLNRELTRFTELKAQSDELGEEIKTLGERIRQHYQAHDLKTVTLAGLEFTCGTEDPLTAVTASRMDRLKNQIKAMKKIRKTTSTMRSTPGRTSVRSRTSHHP